MADANGFNQGDPNYDPSTDPSSPQYNQPSQSGSSTAGGGSQYNLQTQPNQQNVTAQATNPSTTPFDYSRIQANPGETPAQTIARYAADYHAPDAASVNAALANGGYQSWLQNQQNAQNQQGSPSNTTPSTQSFDTSTPQGQLGQVQQWIDQSGSGGIWSAQYLVDRINQTGGFTPQNLGYWQARIAAGAQGEAPGGAYYEAPNSGTSTASSTSTTAATPLSPQDQAIKDALVQQLTTQANQSLNIDASTDPTIRSEADPIEAALQRQQTQYLQQQAEQQGPNANLAGTERLASEQTGQQAGQMESGLVQQEIAARRQEIQDALTSMQGLLTADQQNSLTQELAQLDDATQRYGIQTQAQTAANQQNLNWQQNLMQNQQFLDTLGLNAENQSNYWDAINSGIING